jgi:hypothetical protein
MFTFFEIGTVGVVSVAAASSLLASIALSFISALPRAFEVGFLLDVVATLGVFAGGNISTQSEPDDVDPSHPHPLMQHPRLRMAVAHSSTTEPPRSKPNIFLNKFNKKI